MLIRSVRAENFMRFSKLVVENLPAQGVIGLEGPNESGKSTIGESILFALFGRTRRAEATSVTDLIRWGSDSLRVEVQFALEPSEGRQGATGAASVDYLIYREIDKQGTNYVKLLEFPERKEVATGNIEVERFLCRNVRFDFTEFQRSFYHDQYDNRRVQGDQVSFFETATGITQLESAKEVLQEEVTSLEREFSSFQKELARANTQIEKYDRNARKLDLLDERTMQTDATLDQTRIACATLDEKRGQLERERKRGCEWVKELKGSGEKPLESLVHAVERHLSEASSQAGPLKMEPLERFRDFGRETDELIRRMREDAAELDEALDENAQGVAAEVKKLRSSLDALEQRRVSRARNSWVLLLLALLLIVFTLFLLPGVLPLERVLPAVDSGTGWRKLQADLTKASLSALPWVSGALGVLFLFLSGSLRLRSGTARRRLAEASQAAKDLEEEIARLHKEREALRAGVAEARVGNLRTVFERARTSSRSAVARRVAEMDERHAAVLSGGGEPFEGLVADAVRLDKDLEKWTRREQDKLQKERAAAEDSVQKAQAERSRVLNERRECESQAAKKEELEERKNDLEARATAVRAEIDLRLEACRLLDDAAGTIRSRMGPALAGFARRVLPHLTDQRYRDVKVENGVELLVFSPDKGDFLALEELSGGTNEAVSLALRLALSQALVKSRTHHRQFVLLDEPFKMMDSSRTVSTLKTLRRVSRDLTQFLVIQPTFSQEERDSVDAMIHTRPDSDSLNVGDSLKVGDALEIGSPLAADRANPQVAPSSEPVLPPEPGATT